MDRPALNPDQLNFHHLRNFWVVAVDGTIPMKDSDDQAP